MLTIKVDYHRPPEAVFTETTKSFLKSCEWYRLEYCIFPKDMNLPSWVPDFKKIAAQGVSCNPLSIWNLYQTSKEKQTFEDGLEAGTLLRRGCRADTITSVMDAPEWSLSEKDNDYHFKSVHLWLEAVQNFAQTAYSLEDLWRTLVADIQRYRRTNRTLRVDDLWKALSTQFFGADLLSIEKFLSDDPMIQMSSVQATVVQYSRALVEWAEQIWYGRTIFRTEHTRLGLGPKHMKPRDIVTIIIGTSVPIILRPLPTGRFEFVGEAYVHGIMDGEYMDTNPREESLVLL